MRCVRGKIVTIWSNIQCTEIHLHLFQIEYLFGNPFRKHNATGQDSDDTKIFSATISLQNLISDSCHRTANRILIHNQSFLFHTHLPQQKMPVPSGRQGRHYNIAKIEYAIISEAPCQPHGINLKDSSLLIIPHLNRFVQYFF